MYIVYTCHYLTLAIFCYHLYFVYDLLLDLLVALLHFQQ